MLSDSNVLNTALTSSQSQIQKKYHWRNPMHRHCRVLNDCTRTTSKSSHSCILTNISPIPTPHSNANATLKCHNAHSTTSFLHAPIPTLIFSTVFAPTPFKLLNCLKLVISASPPSSPLFPSSNEHKQSTIASAFLAPTPLRSLICDISLVLMIRSRYFVRGVLFDDVEEGRPSSSSTSLSSRKTDSLGFEGLRILGLGLEAGVEWYSLSLVADSGGSECSSSAGSSEVFFTRRIGTGSGGGGLRVWVVGLLWLCCCSRFSRSFSCSEEIFDCSFSFCGKYGRAS